MNPKELLDFLATAGILKKTPRTGWVDSGISDPESVADHSYLTALAAMLLSDSYGYDTLKVLRMALLHDLAETETGDITPGRKQDDHDIQEAAAMKRVLGKLPENLAALYWDTWVEFQNRASPEAVLVRDADKIEMVLQASEYQKELGIDLTRFYHAMVSDELKNIVEKIKERT